MPHKMTPGRPRRTTIVGTATRCALVGTETRGAIGARCTIVGTETRCARPAQDPAAPGRTERPRRAGGFNDLRRVPPLQAGQSMSAPASHAIGVAGDGACASWSRLGAAGDLRHGLAHQGRQQARLDRPQAAAVQGRE